MKKLPLKVLALIVGLPQLATAAVSDDEFAQLKATLNRLVEQVAALESEIESGHRELRQQPAADAGKANTSSSWADKISLTGDFRYRYESFDTDLSDDRERNRLRGRVTLAATPTDDLEVGIRLASGGNDPVSTNQTLGGAGSTKGIGLDLAYFKWSPRTDVDVIGGKFKNIWYRPEKHGLLWDGDYNPEGVALAYDSGSFFLQGSINFLESDTKKSSHRLAYGVQGGFTTEVGSSTLTAGVGYYDIGVKDRGVYFGDPNDFFGNTFSCTDAVNLVGCTYLNDYEEAEVFAHLTTRMGDLPLKLFANYVNNTAADDFNMGWAAGMTIGRASAPGSWELGYRYQIIEPDAVFGLWTDSDFGGGGTDAKGHVIKAAWAANKKWKIGFTLFLNERNVELGTEEDYRRVQIDSAIKF